MPYRMGLGTLVALLLLTASAEAVAFSAQCREVCAEEIAACVELGNRPRACRRQAIRLCRSEGLGACLSDPPIVLTLKVPGSLSAAPVSSSALFLRWSDISTFEVGFEIERSLSPTSGFVVIATTGANAESYQNGGLAPATRYYYRMRTVGPQGGRSRYSNVASATTLSGPTTSTTPTSTTTTTTATVGTNQPPVANAGPNQFVQTLTSVAFNGSGSSDPNGPIASYTWHFGDGSMASGVSASHSYAVAGTYTA